MLSADIENNLSQRAHRLDCYLVGRAGRAQPENSGYPETSRIGAAIDPCSDIEEHARHLQMLASEVVLNKSSFGLTSEAQAIWPGTTASRGGRIRRAPEL